jgi:hypothetical protein
MPLELRAVFVLYELEQLTLPEIAELAAIPLGTATSRLRRAREQFQAHIKRIEERRKFDEGSRHAMRATDAAGLAEWSGLSQAATAMGVRRDRGALRRGSERPHPAADGAAPAEGAPRQENPAAQRAPVSPEFRSPRDTPVPTGEAETSTRSAKRRP